MQPGTYVPLLTDFSHAHRHAVVELFANTPTFQQSYHKNTGLYYIETTVPVSFPYADTVRKLYSLAIKKHKKFQKPKSQIRSLRWLIRLINEIYDSRFHSYSIHDGADPIPFADFVFTHLKSKFGVTSLLSKFEDEFFNSVQVHSQTSPIADLFRKFLVGSNESDSVYSEDLLHIFLYARSEIRKLVSGPKTGSKRTSLPPQLSSSINRLPPSLSKSSEDGGVMIPNNAIARVAYWVSKDVSSTLHTEVAQRSQKYCTENGITSDVFLKVLVECMVDRRNVPSARPSPSPLEIPPASSPSNPSIEDLLSVDVSPIGSEQHESLEGFMMRSVSMVLNQSPKFSDVELDYAYVEDSESEDISD
ncbi:hypothetical protein P9112_008024 [Eukaryota sp. TZLM1-RC]